MKYLFEAANINFIVFGLTQPGWDPTIYHTWSEYYNRYTTDVDAWRHSFDLADVSSGIDVL
jgi:hypothetical protein